MDSNGHLQPSAPNPARAGPPKDSALPDGFRLFKRTVAKGHPFEVWLKPTTMANAIYWKVVVLSRGETNFANGYVVDGVFRASVVIRNPSGYLMFRASASEGEPNPHVGFQTKFGALSTPI